MSFYSPSIEKLIESFEKLPSIGHKTAQRLAFYMLDLSNEEIEEFIEELGYEDVLIFDGPSYTDAFVGVSDDGRAGIRRTKVYARITKKG